MTTQTKAAWVAADWGTTNLRIWALDASGSTIAYRTSDKGMGKLARQDFEPALLELIGDLLAESGATPVVICGMAGSRQGWAEAPYLTVPSAPPSLADATSVATADSRLDVRILPGLKQLHPADVMRGEETQIAGFLADDPGFEGLLCLPGTHTKWASISAGEILKFRTIMTGELFALLSGQSVLRHGLSDKDMDPTAFKEAVAEAFADSAAFSAELFAIRAAGLVADLAPEAARGRLSGLLIGLELAAMRDAFSDVPIAILGSSSISAAYQSALGSLGRKTRLLDAEMTTLHGLTLACSTCQKVPS